MASDPVFEIPKRPQRSYPRGGGVEYEGETVFRLTPADGPDRDERLTATVESILQDGPYTYGDWFDLPMPLYLVHDEETGDVFRVSVRDGRVELHVLPETESRGLRALYDRLRERSGVGWDVKCHTA